MQIWTIIIFFVLFLLSKFIKYTTLTIIIAIARMLLTCIYHILSKNESSDFERYEQLLQKNFKSKDAKININNAIKFLESQGYKVS